MKFTVQVSRSNLKREAKFSDLESDDKKDMAVSILPFEDQSYQTKMKEIEIAVQV
jgi:hypothetical protein